MFVIVDFREDLYIYVVHGSALPDSTESFENEYKRSSFAAIDAIDASAYVVQILHSCSILKVTMTLAY